MSFGIVLPETGKYTKEKYAVRAEELGYKSVWITELWDENAFVRLGPIANRTANVRLGTSIVNVYSRTPAVLAMSVKSLDRLSEGRFVLGVGVSTPKAITDLHGLPFERPIQRTHDTVELVKAFTETEGPVDYESDLFKVADFPSLQTAVPIYNAALGPANRRVTGEVCDGWLPNNIPFSNLHEAFETIATAAREVNRDPDEIKVSPLVHVVVSNKRDTALDEIRSSIAYYVGSSNGYKNAVGEVYPKQVERITTAWHAGNRNRARELVTNEMVDDLGCAGTVREVHSKLKDLRERTIVDEPIIYIPSSLDDALTERTFEAVAPSNL